MRRVFSLVYPTLIAGLCLALAPLLCGCASEPVQYARLERAPSAVASPCAAPVAAAPCAPMVAAPAPIQLVAAQPVGVEMRVGAAEMTRAALSIPPDVMACLVEGGSNMLIAGVNGIKCALNALVPTPVPSARYVYSLPPPPQFVVPAPRSPVYASPCQ